MIDHTIGHKTKLETTFDDKQPTNVTAIVGKTTYLTCRVRNLGNKTVCFFFFLFVEKKNNKLIVILLQCLL